MEKICNVCNKAKPLDQFYFYKKKNYIYPTCYECTNDRHYNYNYRDKKRKKERGYEQVDGLTTPPTTYTDTEGKNWTFVKEYPTYCRYKDKLGFYSCFSKQELKMIKNKRKEAGPRLIPLLIEKII